MSTPGEPARSNSAPQAEPKQNPGQKNASTGQRTQVTYYFLSELLKCPVRFDGDAKPFGRLRDIGVRKLAMPYPQTVCLQVEPKAGGTQMIPWSAVLDISPRQVVVRREFGELPTPDYWLRRDVLDDQVVSISGAKLIRVNDIHMLLAEGQLVAAHVEVGFLGILRRLGCDRPVRRLLRWLLDYNLKDKFVTWRDLEVIGVGGAGGELHISAAPSQFDEMHPAELADILERLGAQERKTLLQTLPVETAAEALEETDPEIQRALIAQQRPDKAADILEEMAPHGAASVLRDLHASDAQTIISRMEGEAAADVRTLLAHEEETAGGMTASFCIVRGPHQRADEVLESIRAIAEQVEVFSYVYVLDESKHLLGIVSLRELLSASPDATLQTLMTTRLVKVSPDTGLKGLTKLFAKYGFRAIPVVDDQNVFLGAVRLFTVLSQLSPLFKE